MANSNKLLKYYAIVGLLNSIIAAIITAPIFISDWNMARIIAGGSAGTWLTVGYFLFFIVGIGIISICGIVYYAIGNISENGVFSSILALAQLILMEVGVLGACLGLFYAGFVAGNMQIAQQENEVIHPFLAQFTTPTGVFIGIGLLGAIIGIINYVASIVKIK